MKKRTKKLFPIRRLLRIGLNVADLDGATAFYEHALGFTPGLRTPRRQILSFGTQEIELTTPQRPGAPYPSHSTAADLWFQHFAIAVTDIEAAYAALQRHHPTAITTGPPVRLPASSGGVTAYKFRDPDGHPLELIAGLPGPNRIDHSAVSVSDASRSIAFYTALGLRLGASHLNQGREQDRLDGLPNIAVDVVALLPETPTPHVELLAYRTPRGRSAPPLDPDDIAATRLVFEADSNATLRDPDGHLVLLARPTPA